MLTGYVGRFRTGLGQVRRFKFYSRPLSLEFSKISVSLVKCHNNTVPRLVNIYKSIFNFFRAIQTEGKKKNRSPTIEHETHVSMYTLSFHTMPKPKVNWKMIIDRFRYNSQLHDRNSAFFKRIHTCVIHYHFLKKSTKIWTRAWK